MAKENVSFEFRQKQIDEFKKSFSQNKHNAFLTKKHKKIYDIKLCSILTYFDFFCYCCVFCMLLYLLNKLIFL